MQFRHSSAGVWWRQLIVIVTLVMLNVTKVFGDNDDRFVAQQPYSSDSQSVPNPSTDKTATYEEFFIEHNVSQKDAIKSFKEIGQKLLFSNSPVPSWCASMPCTENIMTYCLDGSMLQDHCCCDSRHRSEQLPWIPHSCYVAQKQSCKPKIGSCIAYTEYRECCCDPALAKRWNKIYSSSPKIAVNSYVHLATIVAIGCIWSTIVSCH